jgi:hypothetical protein
LVSFRGFFSEDYILRKKGFEIEKKFRGFGQISSFFFSFEIAVFS